MTIDEKDASILCCERRVHKFPSFYPSRSMAHSFTKLCTSGTNRYVPAAVARIQQYVRIGGSMTRWMKVATTGLLALVISGGAFAESRDRDDRRDRDDSNYYGQRWERGRERGYRPDRDDRGVYKNGWYGNRQYGRSNGWYGNSRYDGRYGNERQQHRDRDRDGDGR